MIPWDCISDCIWLKDNISCRVTFSMIDCYNWFLIFYVNYYSSSGVMEVDVKELFKASP